MKFPSNLKNNGNGQWKESQDELNTHQIRTSQNGDQRIMKKQIQWLADDLFPKKYRLNDHPGYGLSHERRRYIATPPLIGWAHTQNDPCDKDSRIQRILFKKVQSVTYIRNMWFVTINFHIYITYFVGIKPLVYTMIFQWYVTVAPGYF